MVTTFNGDKPYRFFTLTVHDQQTMKTNWDFFSPTTRELTTMSIVAFTLLGTLFVVPIALTQDRYVASPDATAMETPVAVVTPAGLRIDLPGLTLRVTE